MKCRYQNPCARCSEAAAYPTLNSTEEWQRTSGTGYFTTPQRHHKILLAEQRIVDHHPLLFRRFNDPDIYPENSFQCGPGWFPLIEQLAGEIEPMLQAMQDEGIPIKHLPFAVQIKEKFHTLRVYFRGEKGVPQALRDAAERVLGESRGICEICGHCSN